MCQPRARRKARFDGIIIHIAVRCKESSDSENFPSNPPLRELREAQSRIEIAEIEVLQMRFSSLFRYTMSSLQVARDSGLFVQRNHAKGLDPRKQQFGQGSNV